MKTKDIQKLIDVLQEFRSLSPDINATAIIAFLEVAKGEGVSGRSLEGIYNLAPATAARVLRTFDPIQSATRQGLDLFDVQLDPLDYKVRLRYLNDNGKTLIDKVESTLKHR
jgi:hypothetical protein